MAVARITNLTKTFHSGFWPFTKQRLYTAVNDISFEINQGEILGFLGPNGAGKTTTIQMLLGTLLPSSGTIVYFGQNFAQHRIELLKKIGYANGYDRLPLRLTVQENLDIVGRIYGIKQPERAQRIQNLLTQFGMWGKRNDEVGMLSAGQATRVMLAKAFIADPEIVFLDEPTASLDPDITHEIRHFIATQRKNLGTAILITSHNMDEVTELCDRVLVLKNGAIIANEKPSILAKATSKVRIHITISDGLDRFLVYTQQQQLAYTVHDAHTTVELDEHAIAPFLTNLSERKIMYHHISIDKPTLKTPIRR